ncbi:uncharacterized protein [Rutidosis leptorrhynchoides]|uniref:uncharacterized protein n=1 Tax=Rutidosis leptorrhynchoides TaxID=125765 RepID=UPI003A99F707
MGIEFSSSFVKEIGSGSSIIFWSDIWAGNTTLKDQFSRLFALERNKNFSVQERIKQEDNSRTYNWQWIREPRGRATSDFSVLTNLLDQIHLDSTSEDKIKWNLAADGSFSTKALTVLIDGKRLHPGNSVTETIRNKSIPQKVVIFVWRAKLKRLPIRSELDKRGIDLDTVLCPLCGDEIETVEHSLIKCKMVIDFWKSFLRWWNIPVDNLNDLNPLANDSIFSSFSKFGNSIWEGVKWVCCYILWNSMNSKIFKGKEWSNVSILSEVQATSLRWISKRIKKISIDWHQWMLIPEFYVGTRNSRTGVG